MTTTKYISNNHWTLDMFRQGLYSNSLTNIGMVELQTLLFRNSPDSDIASEKNVIQPLNQGAKQCKYKKGYILNKKCECGKTIKDTSGGCRSCSAKHSLTNGRRLKLINKQKEKYKDVFILKEAEQVILGSLLGDGCMRKAKYSPDFVEVHCMEQKDYLDWKSQIINLPSLKYVHYIKKNGNRINYPLYYYATKSIPQLLPYYNMFYPNGATKKKIVTQKILDKLEPLAIAVWYMDDGHYDLEVHLATDCFSYESHLLIQNWFKNKWNINVMIRKNKKGQYHIAIKRKDAQPFINLVKEYIHPCMQYKIVYDLNKFRIKDRAREGTEGRKLSYKNKYIKKRLRIFLNTFCQSCNKHCYGKYCKECEHKNSKRVKGNICADCGNRCTHISVRCFKCNRVYLNNLYKLKMEVQNATI
ncbi:MAG: hypothetical protein AABY22_34575 [Nanoarchaeota archaeon]